MAEGTFIVVFAAVGYDISLRIHPLTKCRYGVTITLPTAPASAAS